MINDIIQLLGLANPQLSKNWTLLGATVPNTAIPVGADGFTMQCGNGAGEEWVAPVTAILTKNQHLDKITLPNGTTPPTGSYVLQPSASVYLAMVRLYSRMIDAGKTNANSHLSDRPVPRYFVFTSTTNLAWVDGSDNKTGPDNGLFTAGSQLHFQGSLTVHDEEGIVIDPLAVAAAFNFFINTHWALENKSIGDTTANAAPPFTAAAQRQINQLLPTGTPDKRVLFTTIYNGAFQPATFPFGNVSQVAGTGLYKMTNAANPITKNAGVDDNIELALAPNGKFSNTLTYPAGGAGLARDFIRVKVADWKAHLIGSAPATEPTVQNNLLPIIRKNEAISFALNGNDCLGEVARMTAGAPPTAMIASVDITNDFALPTPPDGTGNDLWPQFAQGVPTSTADIPANLFTNPAAPITLTAHYVTDATVLNTDVYFEMSGAALQNGWAIRLYTRVFNTTDGSETRGDGGGTIVRNNKAAFILKDPLHIFRPFTAGITPPVNGILMVDAMVINGANPVKNRLFGSITTTIAAAAALSAAEQAAILPGTNTLNTIATRGTAPGGFLGIRTSPQPINAITNVMSFILATGSDGPPFVAPALPTQSRLEGLAASKTGSNWSALNSGLRMTKDSVENFLRQGNPGSPGGKDIHTTGAVTTNGRLAFDLTRATMRRTMKIGTRMAKLTNDIAFALPTEPAATGRNMIAAVLQNIAKGTESPRFNEDAPAMTKLPADAATLSTQIQNLLTNDTKPAWLPPAIKDQVKTALTGTTAAADKQAAFDELKREYAASMFGRRDSFYAIKAAIENAKQFIYIEGTFFGQTAYPSGDPNDLVQILKTQLTQKPGLKLMLCLAEEIPANRGYENFARLHTQLRKNAIADLLGPITNGVAQRNNQMVAFHPLGFPGRPVKIATQVIIADDVWACMGTSAISQRGLFFDGSTDVVFADKQLQYGKGTSITSLRKSLMQQYLRTASALPNMPTAIQVALQHGWDAFNMLRQLADSGGAGMIKQIKQEDISDLPPNVVAALQNLADPNGDTFYQAQAVLTTWLAALSTVPE